MATFTLVLDTRVKKKNDQYNLSIRVINGSEQIYLNISKMTIEKPMMNAVSSENSGNIS